MTGNIVELNTWQKIVTGIAVVMVGLIATGFWAVAWLQHRLYPVAGPMPAIVSDSMPVVLARLETALKTNAPQVLASLQPGISSGNIEKLEQRYHVQIPDDIQAIYEWHDGARRSTNEIVEFIPMYRFLPLEEALEDRQLSAAAPATAIQRAAYRVLLGYRNSWICLFDAEDGGGYWFDPKRKPSEGFLFFNFTEDAEYTFFPSAKNLMAGIAECYEQKIFRVKPGASPLQLDEDLDRSPKVWAEFGVSTQ